jgi:hypothetical protein
MASRICHISNPIFYVAQRASQIICETISKDRLRCINGLKSLSQQLAIHTLDGLKSYRKGEQREEHVTKIRKRYGYGDFTEPRVGFRMTRWLSKNTYVRG